MGPYPQSVALPRPHTGPPGAWKGVCEWRGLSMKNSFSNHKAHVSHSTHTLMSVTSETTHV